MSIPEVPKGYRYFKGDGKTPFISGSKLLRRDKWIEAEGDPFGLEVVFGMNASYAIPDPAPVEMKCPACGKGLTKHERFPTKAWCAKDGCPLVNNCFELAFWKRLHVDPEPLKCPECGSPCVTSDSHSFGYYTCCTRLDCMLTGPRKPTVNAAESAFRRIRVEKEAGV